MSDKINFVLLDSARMLDNIDTALELNKNGQSLYIEKGERVLASVAPYLFNFFSESKFENWLHEKGWGNSWGVFVNAEESIEILYKHFRRFLMVKTEDGEQLYFRFYDPRVLRIFLPTCDEKQLIEFFGPVEMFVMEDEDINFAIRFWLAEGKLCTDRITKEEFISGKIDSKHNISEKKTEDSKNKKDIPPNKRFSILD